MVTEWKLFVGLGVFMLPLGIIYWFTSYEEAGSLMLVILAIAFLFMGVYLWWESRKMNGLRPEDYDSLPSDGEGEVGSFPVGSIWPFVGASGVLLIGYGLIFTTFLVTPGLFLIVATIIGMARESYQAEIGHVPLDEHNDVDATPIENAFSDQVKK